MRNYNGYSKKEDIKTKMTNYKGYFKKVREKVVKSPNILLNKENKEIYFHNFLMSFKPWRKEEINVLNDFNIYEETLIFFNL